MTMTVGTEVEEGIAYHDSNTTRLYDPRDRESLEQVLFQKCIQWSLGPLTIKLCVDTSPLSLSVEASLLGYTIANCTLTPAKPSCTIGGTIAGFTAQIKITLETSPLAVNLDGKLCAPLVGCKEFDVTIPI